MPEITCKCGSTDYRTEVSGPHNKAVCNKCNSYIKFLPQPVTDETLMPYGKYKDKPLGTIPISYWDYMLKQGALNGAIKLYASRLVYEAK